MPRELLKQPRVYLISDVRLYREGLTSYLAAHGQLSIVGAGGEADALQQIAHLSPDVMLLDLRTQDSLLLARLSMTVVPALRVVAFAVGEAAADVLACAEAGISGYIPKDASVEDVFAAVLRAVSGELVCSPRIAAMLFRRVAALSTERGAAPSPDSLTRRELEIAELVCHGLPNKAIARKLQIGPATIKNHVHNILQKLKLHRRGEKKLKLHRRGEISGLRLNSTYEQAGQAEATRHPHPSC